MSNVYVIKRGNEYATGQGCMAPSRGWTPSQRKAFKFREGVSSFWDARSWAEAHMGLLSYHFDGMRPVRIVPRKGA